MADDPIGILNWRRVDGRLTTSGQPDAGQLAEIAALGVRHVVNLGLATHPRALPDEAGTVAALGMVYHHLPVDFEQPTDADFEAFAATMAAIGDAPAHVHCIVNARVTAFLYRLTCRDGGDAAKAAAVMDSVWRPGEVWAAFIGDADRQGVPSSFAGRDY